MTARLPTAANPPDGRRPSVRLRAIGRAVGGQNASLLVALILLVAIIGFNNPNFFLAQNLLNIGVSVTLLGLVAMPQTVAIISAGLDVSVGSMVGLASVTTAIGLLDGKPLVIGLAVGLATGLAAGIFNGLIIAYGRINPIIATLGTYTAYQGITYIVVNGQAISMTNQDLLQVSTGTFFGVPQPLLILIATIAFFFVFLRYTDIGRNIFALGGNPTAARLAGINPTRYRLGIYALSGLVCGLAGILLTARIGAGLAESGAVNLGLESITAVVLGGVALTGGRGSIVGVTLGVLLLGTLDDGLVLTNVPAFYQLVARGSLLIVAVLIQEWRGSMFRPSRRRTNVRVPEAEGHQTDIQA